MNNQTATLLNRDVALTGVRKTWPVASVTLAGGASPSAPAGLGTRISCQAKTERLNGDRFGWPRTRKESADLGGRDRHSVSRPVVGRSMTATSEIMDATAGRDRQLSVNQKDPSCTLRPLITSSRQTSNSRQWPVFVRRRKRTVIFWKRNCRMVPTRHSSFGHIGPMQCGSTLLSPVTLTARLAPDLPSAPQRRRSARNISSLPSRQTRTRRCPRGAAGAFSPYRPSEENGCRRSPPIVVTITRVSARTYAFQSKAPFITALQRVAIRDTRG